jgi:hypothetical protein
MRRRQAANPGQIRDQGAPEGLVLILAGHRPAKSAALRMARMRQPRIPKPHSEVPLAGNGKAVPRAMVARGMKRRTTKLLKVNPRTVRRDRAEEGSLALVKWVLPADVDEQARPIGRVQMRMTRIGPVHLTLLLQAVKPALVPRGKEASVSRTAPTDGRDLIQKTKELAVVLKESYQALMEVPTRTNPLVGRLLVVPAE